MRVTTAEPPASPPPSEAAEREARLVAALRANLRRRKQIGAKPKDADEKDS